MAPALPTKKTVLIADGSEDVRVMASQALAGAGYRVLLAADGIEALSLLQRGAADMLLCDLFLPQLDGLQTCRLVRRHAGLASLPVAMLSAVHGLFDQARCAVSGADEFLAKPFTAEALLGLVRAHVDGLEETA